MAVKARGVQQLPEEGPSPRAELREWIEDVHWILLMGTAGELVRLRRKRVAAFPRVSMILAELRDLWHRAPSPAQRLRTHVLNKEGPLGVPPEPSGLEACAGTVAAVLWAARVTYENNHVPARLTRAISKGVTEGPTQVSKRHARAFLDLLFRSLDRNNLAAMRAQGLLEVAQLRWPDTFGALPNLTSGRRLWLVTLARLLKEGKLEIGHKAIAEAASRSLSWSGQMAGTLRRMGFVPKRPPHGAAGFNLTAKGKAWIAQHEPSLA